MTALPGCGEVEGKAATAAERPTPSGLPVPRWVTLKSRKTNARQGPSEDHRVLWTYSVQGLPVQIVAETRDWRRICDGEGGLAWVKKTLLTGERNVLNLSGAPVALAADPAPGAASRAYLAPGTMASLDRCEDGWCRVRAGSASGWAAPDTLWGTSEALGCGVRPRG